MLSILFNSSRRNAPQSAEQQSANRPPIFKRLIDIVLSSMLILILAPGLAFIGLLLLVVDGRPILFSHERVGFGGTKFKCLKFRTMRRDSQERLAEILKSDEQRRLEWERSQKLENDPRVHWMGKLLRTSSLDELPQLLNVLKGEMSIVGPRPVVDAELEKYGESSELYLAMTPGITGLWQISGRNKTTYTERVRLDVEYFHRRSFWLDLQIMAKTLPLLLFDHNGR